MSENQSKNDTEQKKTASVEMPEKQAENESFFSSKKIEELEKELGSFKDKYLRTLAEMENMRKRLQKEKEESIRFAVESTIVDFLSPLDNFENALKLAENSSPEIKKWAIGFEMILSQFKEVLHSNGIIAFHSQGTYFDPSMHDAMEIVETKEIEDGKILDEFTKGYKTQFRVIRPAGVKVAKKPKEITALKEEKIKE